MFDLGIIRPHTEEEKQFASHVTFGFSGTQVMFDEK